MLVAIIILSIVVGILAMILYLQDHKNVHLASDNIVLQARVEGLQEKQTEVLIPDEDLSPEGIEDAVRQAGYIPERMDGHIRLMVQGESYSVSTDRLPLVFVLKGYTVDEKDWEMDLFRKAAHQMSDDLAIVKATFDEYDEVVHLRFFTASRDNTIRGLRDNLPAYIDLIDEGRRRMSEIYDELIKERDEPITTAPLFPAAPYEKKIYS